MFGNIPRCEKQAQGRAKGEVRSSKIAVPARRAGVEAPLIRSSRRVARRNPERVGAKGLDDFNDLDGFPAL